MSDAVIDTSSLHFRVSLFFIPFLGGGGFLTTVTLQGQNALVPDVF